MKILLIEDNQKLAGYIENLEYEGPDYKGNVDLEAQIFEKAQDRLQAILLTVDGLIVILV